MAQELSKGSTEQDGMPAVWEKKGEPFVKVTRLPKASHTRIYKQEERPVLYTWKVIIQYGIGFFCVGVGQANIDCNWGNFVAGRLRH